MVLDLVQAPAFSDAGPVDVDGFPENFCHRFATKGTIKGNYISCIVPDPDGEEFVVGPPSRASIFALGPWTHEVEGIGEVSDAYSIHWDEWIETKDGTLHLHSYGVTDFWGTASQATLGKVMPDGTGRFAGATGEIFSSVASGRVRSTGSICTQWKSFTANRACKAGLAARDRWLLGS